MKKLLLASVLTVIASNAFASGLYISPKIGWTYNKQNDFEYHHNASGLIVAKEFGSDGSSTVHAGIAAGYDFHKSFGLNLRVEGEYLYHSKADIEKEFLTITRKFEDEIHSFNANVYYDFRNSTGFTPYVGAGIGYALVNAKYYDDFFVSSTYSSGEGSKNNNKLTWNLQAGLDYHFNDHNAIGLGYRFTEYGKIKSGFYVNDTMSGYDEKSSVKTYTHELTLSYRYTF